MLSFVVWLSASIGIYKSIQSFGGNTVRKDDAKASSTYAEPAKRRVLQVTRSHCLLSDVFPSEKSIIKLIESSISKAVDGVLICVGANTLDKLQALQEHFEQVVARTNETQRVFVLPVHPWGHFTSSLNAAVIFAQDKGYSHILFQSFEVKAEEDDVSTLLDHFDADTLVVGWAMEGHCFSAGEQRLDGRTTPWNTLAMWDTGKLGLLGFPLIGDGVGSDRQIGGVEEVSAIAALQCLHPTYSAKLLRKKQDSLQWDTTFSNPQRREYHERKMKSKISRPQKQMELLGIQDGKVLHIGV